MAWESSRRWGKSLSPSTCMGDLEEVPDSWLRIGTAPPLQPFVLFLVLSQMPSTTPPVPKWQSLLEPKTHASGPEVDSLPSSISDAVWNNTLLGSLVVFASLLVLCNTQCYVELYDKNPEDPPDECRDLDGVTHKLNVPWMTENCYRCSCDETGIHCCNTAAIPGGFDTTKCKTIFHKDTCSYSVVELENPDKECPVSSWIL